MALIALLQAALQIVNTMRSHTVTLLTPWTTRHASATSIPHLNVPSCPAKATIQYHRSVPDRGDFPLTKVDMCYNNKAFEFEFIGYNETNFYFNSSYKTNDPIWEYEVMEAFIAPGTNDPETYFEFEVAPNNVTFNAYIYNPSKIRGKDAPFERCYVPDPLHIGLVSHTTLNKFERIWVSSARIPLSMFSIRAGRAKGTQWRMNFFRTVVGPEMFPKQSYGAWSSPSKPNFHMTPFFGVVTLV